MRYIPKNCIDIFVMTTAFYSGSFDPVTNGHLDVIRQALRFADSVIVGIGEHATKDSLFSVDERKKLLTSSIDDSRVTVVTFSGLAVDAAVESGATIIVRGVRDSSDIDYELRMSGMNSVLSPDVTTIFLPASSSVRHITATLVRQVARMGGDISEFVPPCVVTAFTSQKNKNN